MNGTSIIIPAYKASKFISECIDSIFNSKEVEDINIQVLIGIDGCEETLNYIKSTDILKKCNVYYSENNVGPYIIRNSLLEISKYEKIIFFDSDDIMNEYLIKIIYDELNNFDSIRAAYLNFNNDDPTNLFKGNLPYSHGQFGVKKSDILSLNGFLPWKCSADTEFLHRFDRNGFNMATISEPLFYRRYHGENLTQNDNTGLHTEYRKKISEEIKDRVNNNGLINPEKLHTTKMTNI